MLTPEELEALDTWRFQRRMPSRAAAVRELLKRGLTAEGVSAPGGRSQDYGVLDGPGDDGHGQGADGRTRDGHGPGGSGDGAAS
jgi:hypothetical protein